MAKQLLIIRHAKSDWGNANLHDFDRPLNKRGTANAPEMAQRLSNQQIIPQLIVSSPALRAITTAKYFAKAWKISSKDIQQESEIYEANVKALLSVITNFDNELDIIALFGHNPGLTDLANYLSNAHIYNMPTCSVVFIEFPFDDWEEVSANTGKVLLFDYPKSLDD
ncbi:SixA phosphatase family protein [Pedobacter boryungensis]|uniref:Histidine phosphatase family protein n=1 Tax=Pedobacter boryungensis TaxID=869962 RepID=A0ABX2D8Q6_9SPHI|nr:histidine phosphatase family protein [Pedobacter boryungensis]NQX30402.1 histidine phosphatase family protein [Pedobacter boryungensis]